MFSKRGVLKQLYQKETPTQVLSCEICEIFKNTCYEEQLQTTVSESLQLSVCSEVTQVKRKLPLRTYRLPKIIAKSPVRIKISGTKNKSVCAKIILIHSFIGIGCLTQLWAIRVELIPKKIDCAQSRVFPFCRSSYQRCSIKKGVFRNFTKFTGKHLYQGLLFNKVAGLRLQF